MWQKQNFALNFFFFPETIWIGFYLLKIILLGNFPTLTAQQKGLFLGQKAGWIKGLRRKLENLLTYWI